MATFGACDDLHRHKASRAAGLAAITFCAHDPDEQDNLYNAHPSGIPPATAAIHGRFQYLKTISHPNLCQYVEIIKGKRDRLFVVSEHYHESLGRVMDVFVQQEAEDTSPKGCSIPQLQTWASQILTALEFLNAHGIAHRALKLSNVLLDPQGNVKLSNYGLFHMTMGGTLVQFSMDDPHYMSPQSLGTEHLPLTLKNYALDLWSLGVMLVELFLGESFWHKERSDVEELIGSLLAIRRLSIKSRDWIQAAALVEGDDTTGINPLVLKFLKTGTKGSSADSRTNGTLLEDGDVKGFYSFVKECLRLDTKQEALDPTGLRRHEFIAAIEQNPTNEQALIHDSTGDAEILLETMESPLDRNLSLTTLPDLEGRVKELAIWAATRSLTNSVITTSNIKEPSPPNLTLPSSLSSSSSLDAKPERIHDRMPLNQVFYLWKLAGGDVEAQFRRNGRLVGTPVIQLLPKIVRVAEDGISKEDQRPQIRDVADLFSDEICVLPLENLEAEILRSIHEPNKNQFAWDTDYFMFNDPDELNFLADSSAAVGAGMMGGHKRLFSDSSMASDPTMSLRPAPTPSLSNGGLLEAQSLAQQPSKIRAKVPLLIREKDLGYQYQRLQMFTDLLLQYPASRSEILHHSKIDIPPLLRDKVWAAILNVRGDYQSLYESFDKYTDKETDRQIELDVPRCHQYNQLMFSSTGHEKLKRLLKCWVEANVHQVYWQGLDSCFAPFLTLSFNDEALVFASMEQFLRKYLKDMFLHDNSHIIHEYLAVFRHLLSFQDPELGSHLDFIGFVPQLYAISWFMTLFTHIFPLDKIYHLWDKILVGPSSLPLFVGIAILQQFRQELLNSEFNDAISVFSESFPEMDIEKCIETALSMCRVTPPSTYWLSYDHHQRQGQSFQNVDEGGEEDYELSVSEGEGLNGQNTNGASTNIPKSTTTGNSLQQPRPWWEESLSIEIMNQELSPRIQLLDLLRLKQQVLVIDIRPESEFKVAHYPLSIQLVSVQLDLLLPILKKLKRKYTVVLGPAKGTATGQFANQLVRAGFQRVATLMGGIESLKAMSTEHSAAMTTSTTMSGLSTPVITSVIPAIPSSPSLASPVCICRPIRQPITSVSKARQDIVVHKCKTPFVNAKKRL